jgi:Flp pilus assembly protein TadG
MLIKSRDGGSAIVEMAVALPVLMLIMTGIFSFSIALYQKLLLAEAVSAGARYLSVDRGDVDPCTTASNLIYANAPGLNKADVSLTYTLNGVSYGAGVTTCPGAKSTANPNMVATKSAEVDATYPCSLQVYGMKFTSCSLATQVSEVVQ